MKNILYFLLISVPLLATTPSVVYQHFDGLKVGDKAQPAGSDVLVDMKSTTAGLLIPRMTTTQRLALSNPPDGLLVFDTNLQTVVEYNTTLASWTFLVASSGGAVLNNNVAVVTDGSGNLSSGTASSTQVNYLSTLAAATQGDVVYTNGTGLIGLPAGTANYVLTANGAGAAPTWNQSVSSAGGVNIGATAANSTYYPVFVSSTTNNTTQNEFVGSGLSFNPGTDVLTSTTFSGALSGNATSATNVATTATTTNASYFPLLAPSSTNSNQAASLMTGLTFNPGTDVLVAGNHVTGYATTVTAGATTTLTVSSPGQQFFTGSTTQTVLLPVASTLSLGHQYFIVNNSSGTVTVQSSGGNTIQAMTGSTFAIFTCILASGTGTSSWSAEYTATGTPTFSGLTQWGSIYADSTTTVKSTSSGTTGDVIVAQGSAAPIFQTLLSFAASSQVTTNSTAIASGTFTTFSNSPALTFTPKTTGTYKVYCSIPVLSTAGGASETRIIATSGSPTLLYESQGVSNASGISDQGTTYVQSVYTLNANSTYVFDIQGATAANITAVGSTAPFYMFLERVQ